MPDPQMFPDDYTGPVAFLTAAGALLASVFRRGVSRHTLNNTVHPVATRVSILETQYREIDRRLAAIEKGQERVLEKLDDVLRQR